MESYSYSVKSNPTKSVSKLCKGEKYEEGSKHKGDE
jgi:hypothetical protein